MCLSVVYVYIVALYYYVARRIWFIFNDYCYHINDYSMFILYDDHFSYIAVYGYFLYKAN